MVSKAEELRNRTKIFALNIIKLYQTLERDGVSQVLGKQLLRSSTSVAANYRAAVRGRSPKEFYAKLCIVVEESDESLFWLELIDEADVAHNIKNLKSLKDEADQLTAIFTKSKYTLSKSLNNKTQTHNS